MAREVPTSYKDPFWRDVASQMESKHGLPDGLVQGIILHGEKSNHDQVSSSGARTVAQIMPNTRKLFLDKYGVDAYASPENAVEVAALHLKESLDRNKGDVPTAIREYHAGPNRAGWGKINNAYVNRVMSNLGSVQGYKQQSQQASSPQQQAPAMNLAAIHQAYESGEMDAEAAAAYEEDVNAGKIMLPRGASLKQAASAPPESIRDPNQIPLLPSDIAEIYARGEMDADAAIALEQDVASGVVRMPEGYGLRQTTPDWNAREVVEGARTFGRGATLGISDVAGAGIAAIPAAITTGQPVGEAFSDIRQGIQADRDAFAERRPATALSLELAGGVAPAILTGGATSGATLAATAGRAGVNLAPSAARTLAAAGVGAAEGAIYGATQAAEGQVGSEALKGAAIGGALGGALSKGADVVAGMRRGGNAAPAGVAQMTDDAIPSSGAQNAPAVATTEAAEVAAETPSIQAAGLAAEPDRAEFAALIRQAQGSGAKAQDAKQVLAERIKANPETVQAAEDLGLELPFDMLTDDILAKQTMGMIRSQHATEASAEFASKAKEVADRIDQTLIDLGANPDISVMSETVKARIMADRDAIKNASSRIYKMVDEAVPPSSPVALDKTAAYLTKQLESVRAERLEPWQKRLLELSTDPNTTYAEFMKERKAIGQALGSKMSQGIYGDADRAMLSAAYSQMAGDQIANVRRIGGDDVASNLLQAHKATQKQKKLEDAIKYGFGKEGEGSIASKIQASINSGAKRGDVAALKKAMASVPQDLKKEAVLSALFSLSRSGAREGADGVSRGLNAAALRSMYSGLRDNSEAYKVVADTLSPEEQKLMQSTYIMTGALDTALKGIIHTGKANQLQQDLIVENALEKFLGTKTAGALQNVAAGGGLSGGIISDAAAILANAVVSTPAQKLDAAANVFKSKEFTDVLASSVKNGGEPDGQLVKRLAMAKDFAKFARQAGIESSLKAREQYIILAMSAREKLEQNQSAESNPEGKF